MNKVILMNSYEHNMSRARFHRRAWSEAHVAGNFEAAAEHKRNENRHRANCEALERQLLAD